MGRIIYVGIYLRLTYIKLHMDSITITKCNTWLTHINVKTFIKQNVWDLQQARYWRHDCKYTSIKHLADLEDVEADLFVLKLNII